MVQNAPLPKQTGERTSYADVISNVAPSVVSVLTHTDLTKKSPTELTHHPLVRRFLEQKGHSQASIPHELEGLGSGVIISREGYILTDAHVVEGADTITVTTAGGEDLKATVVGSDPATDVAVLKVSAKNLTAAVLGDSNGLRVGDIVLAIGNPFGMGQTVTSGIISATERTGLGITEYEDFIQTDASINPGNSGGALIDARGRVIGINCAILSSGGGFEGIGLAVPINMARNVMQQLISRGKVIRGYLGVAVQTLNAQLAGVLKLPSSKGALVTSVAPNSPASRAGMKEGDVLLEINGSPVANGRDLRLFIAQTPPGTRLKLRVHRLGSQKTLMATLSELAKAQTEPPRRPASLSSHY